MGSYQPRVTCLDGDVEPIPQVFRHLWSLIPVSQERVRFGRAPLAAGVTEKLPIVYPGMSNPLLHVVLSRHTIPSDDLETVPFGHAGLVATIDINEGETEVSSWYDIWASFPAISNLCLDAEYAGAARVGKFNFVGIEAECRLTVAHKGDNGKIAVIIEEA